jgi:hypothetical protein
MSFTGVLQFGYDVVVLCAMVYMPGRGYRRRRPYWSRHSWLRFGGVFGGGLAMTVAAIVQAYKST